MDDAAFAKAVLEIELRVALGNAKVRDCGVLVDADEGTITVNRYIPAGFVYMIRKPDPLPVPVL